MKTVKSVIAQLTAIIPVVLIVLNALVQAGALHPSAKVLSVANAVLAALGLGSLHPAVQAKLTSAK